MDENSEKVVNRVEDELEISNILTDFFQTEFQSDFNNLMMLGRDEYDIMMNLLKKIDNPDALSVGGTDAGSSTFYIKPIEESLPKLVDNKFQLLAYEIDDPDVVIIEVNLNLLMSLIELGDSDFFQDEEDKKSTIKRVVEQYSQRIPQAVLLLKSLQHEKEESGEDRIKDFYLGISHFIEIRNFTVGGKLYPGLDAAPEEIFPLLVNEHIELYNFHEEEYHQLEPKDLDDFNKVVKEYTTVDKTNSVLMIKMNMI